MSNMNELHNSATDIVCKYNAMKQLHFKERLCFWVTWIS